MVLGRLTTRLYVAVFSLPFVIQLFFSLVLPSGMILQSETYLFTLVVISTSLCVVTSAMLLRRAFRRDIAELAWLGLFFLSVSLLPLVHGLTIPGVIYGPNDATTMTLFLAIPLGMLAAAPTFTSRFGVLARTWRGWSISWIVGLTVLALVMLVAPDLVPLLDPRSIGGLLVLGAGFVGSMMLGHRHLRLARIADRPAPLVITAGYSFVAASAAMLVGSTPYSAGFWVAHGFDVAGVFAATLGGLVVYRRSPSMSEVLVPVLVVDPVAALEVGMHPAVAEFVADLDRKDRLTRDHVVRTAELAIEVAASMGLSPELQRQAGLVGALHDIGKLEIPSEILDKPGGLDDDEWAVMRSHAELGAALVAGSPPLASLASSVRAHHERMDGTGYPDGLAGEQIPLVARIVSVCDAYDAMAFTRVYRSGMNEDEVIAILRENAGSQWDPAVVDAAIGVVSLKQNWVPTLLADQRADLCDCVPEHLVVGP